MTVYGVKKKNTHTDNTTVIFLYVYNTCSFWLMILYSYLWIWIWKLKKKKTSLFSLSLSLKYFLLWLHINQLFSPKRSELPFSWHTTSHTTSTPLMSARINRKQFFLRYGWGLSLAFLLVVSHTFIIHWQLKLVFGHLSVLLNDINNIYIFSKLLRINHVSRLPLPYTKTLHFTYTIH